jgi:hypothetical protein
MPHRKVRLPIRARLDGQLLTVDVGAVHGCWLSPFTGNGFLVPAMGLVLGFATGVNFPEGTAVTLVVEEAVPQTLVKAIESYRRFGGKHAFKVECKKKFMAVKSNPGHVLLFSGGKDSVAQALRLKNHQEKPTLLYVGGALGNAEWLREVAHARKIAALLQLPLHEIITSHASYGEVPFRLPLRTIWRNILLLLLASQFGNEIYIGNTRDLKFQKKWKNVPARPEYYEYAYHYADAPPVQHALCKAFSISIHEGPSEAENLNYLRHAHPQILSECCWCVAPQPCDNQMDPKTWCPKCKTRFLLDALEAGGEVPKWVRSFANENLWMGDDDISQALGFFDDDDD